MQALAIAAAAFVAAGDPWTAPVATVRAELSAIVADSVAMSGHAIHAGLSQLVADQHCADAI